MKGKTLDEKGCGQGKAEVGAVEGKLDERGLSIAHLHHFLEGRQQRVGHVIGKSPKQEQHGDKRKRQEVSSFEGFHCQFISFW